jgi:hypothetical protein
MWGCCKAKNWREGVGKWDWWSLIWDGRLEGIGEKGEEMERVGGGEICGCDWRELRVL